jgi:predicted TIM-barrel fold metal-dependent hydrolase
MIAIPGTADPPEIVPSRFLDHITIDTVANGPVMLAAALGRWDVSKILFGTDHPYQAIAPQMQLLEQSTLSAEARDQVFSENAKRIFRIA